MRSVSAKVFLAFLAVMITFGGVTAYSALTVRRLGDQLRRISRGYLVLRLKLHDLQTHQANLLQEIERTDEDSLRATGFLRGALVTGRAYRKKNLRELVELVAGMAGDASSREEEVFLRSVDARLHAMAQVFAEDEVLFDEIYGVPSRPGESRSDARERLLRREEKVWQKDLGDLSRDLRGQVAEAEAHLERDEQRGLWATVLLAITAALIGLGVMFLVQRALAPLRRLSIGAQQLARGDYQQRVGVASNDEIGALAREFNAMAAALEEREVRLIRSERLAAVGKIAAQITHEVRNPLSSIGLNAELLEEELGKAGTNHEEAQVLVRAIIQEVDRLTQITEQYLRLTRLPRPRLEREDANGLVSSLLAFLKEELAGRSIQVETQLGSDLPLILGDENQLRQALLNLLRNSTEAMGEGGQLTVSTAATTSHVTIAIRDTGEGIDPAHRAKIFEPFFSTKKGGTGLGLALTQQIIIEHGGAIDVESDPGKGTRFTVRLPRAPSDRAV